MEKKKFQKIVYDVLKVLDKAVVYDTVVYDMAEITPFYDYSIITSSNNSRQGNAAIDYLRDEAPKLGLDVHSFSVSQDAKWLLVDLGIIVVHVFVGEERARYRLDDLYSSLPNEKII